jgi:hypothetical protein
VPIGSENRGEDFFGNKEGADRMNYTHKSGFGPSGVIFCAFFTFAAIGFAGTYLGGTGTTGGGWISP